MEIKDCTETLAWCLKMPLSIAGIVVANVGHDGQAIHFLGCCHQFSHKTLWLTWLTSKKSDSSQLNGEKNRANASFPGIGMVPIVI